MRPGTEGVESGLRAAVPGQQAAMQRGAHTLGPGEAQPREGHYLPGSDLWAPMRGSVRAIRRWIFASCRTIT